MEAALNELFYFLNYNLSPRLTFMRKARLLRSLSGFLKIFFTDPQFSRAGRDAMFRAQSQPICSDPHFYKENYKIFGKLYHLVYHKLPSIDYIRVVRTGSARIKLKKWRTRTTQNTWGKLKPWRTKTTWKTCRTYMEERRNMEGLKDGGEFEDIQADEDIDYIDYMKGIDNMEEMGDMNDLKDLEDIGRH